MHLRNKFRECFVKRSETDKKKYISADTTKRLPQVIREGLFTRIKEVVTYEYRDECKVTDDLKNDFNGFVEKYKKLYFTHTNCSELCNNKDASTVFNSKRVKGEASHLSISVNINNSIKVPSSVKIFRIKDSKKKYNKRQIEKEENNNSDFLTMVKRVEEKMGNLNFVEEANQYFNESKWKMDEENGNNGGTKKFRSSISDNSIINRWNTGPNSNF